MPNDAPGNDKFTAPCLRSLEFSHSTKILIYLRRGETNQQNISQHLREDPGTVARELRRLRDEGLLSMRRDTRGDAEYSMNFYSLTESGRMLAAALTIAWKDPTGERGILGEALASLDGVLGPYDLDPLYPEPEAVRRRRRDCRNEPTDPRRRAGWNYRP